MAKILDNVKYSGEMALYFSAKSAKYVADIGDGIPLLITILASSTAGMIYNMDDVDNVGTKDQAVVYEQISNRVENLKSSLEKMQTLTTELDALKEVQSNVRVLSLLKKGSSLDGVAGNVKQELNEINDGIKSRSKSIIADIHLTGNKEEGLALSEKQAQELLLKVQELNIPAPYGLVTYDSFMGHLDAVRADIDVPENASISARYEKVKDMHIKAAKADLLGFMGAFAGFVGLFAMSALVIDPLQDNRIIKNKPKKPKPYGLH